MGLRRRPGVGGLQQRTRAHDQFQRVGEQTKEQRMQQMKIQMEKFKKSLEEFALKHRQAIRKDPVFRAQFHTMCSKIGVDPLASNKGYWTKLLGIGDFYYDLSVQVVEACWSNRSTNGGLMEIGTLKKCVQAQRGSTADPITVEDLKTAIDKIKCLGHGFEVMTVGNQTLVKSVPQELNMDKSKILEMAQHTGYISKHQLNDLGWTEHRINQTLEELLKDGMGMVDDGGGDGVRLYWFLCLIQTSLS